MKYSENIYMKALAALAALRTTLSEKEQHTVDFVAEAIAEKADRDTGPATNADHIRTMSDEEMAAWVLRLVDCDKENMMCNPAEYKHSGKCDGRCLQGRLDWLRQPAEEGQDNS